jgi:hypothetical protein
MGCGCGRKRVGRAARIKKQSARILKARKSLKKRIQATAVKAVSVSPLTANASTCLSCIESKQSSDELKKGIKVCHKTNRLIRNIIKDPRFTCPLGKWNKSK